MISLTRLSGNPGARSIAIGVCAHKFARLYANYPPLITVDGKAYETDEWTNVPKLILALTDRQLHQKPNHPIGILRELIQNNFKGLGYTFYNDFRPTVTTYQNFDVLEFPADHPGRSKLDTYYLNKGHLLRTHTSAHEHECFQICETPGYFITADVYRRDEIDRTHYPAFHQMEGARLWSKQNPELLKELQNDIDSIPNTNIIVEDPFRENPSNAENPKQQYMTDPEVRLVATHLKKTVEYMVNLVFEKARESALKAGSKEEYLNEPLKVRWVEAYFPWTSPSWEIEVWWKGEWLECCGCGVVQQQILLNSGLPVDKLGWAFGVGLDRIAMLLFGIPDIRLFWSLDERFARQFTQGTISTFQPYSKYPGVKRDVSYWLPSESPLHTNDVMEIVRLHGGDLVESVVLKDEFVHPKTGRKSQCYGIHFQSMDRNLTNSEVNEIHKLVEKDLIETYGVEIR
ncbi:phenylalanyl-tRNA synthetase [Metschnikowia bicuspidata var. bicuspidata NRRL YB-4993]|uniref:Phenylalanine--tRNA ligase, mitochondrial n=1 Tax=Metschnikowia bicuspidata var. bicuspidata NRRL YB-4993 TaxID=869754 RepID=A0A1A0HHE0_9ASCO|nr:phenylalanyl-tRNA synthetase [Metschnikowia bicuspidata var. bicuspidata NRRL YB-4993]OBA23292.1 phenylalanyl-tRNA synthetase [Metschnikowia bicuspidata var. bicuspidata NRRL YB-4993]